VKVFSLDGCLVLQEEIAAPVGNLLFPKTMQPGMYHVLLFNEMGVGIATKVLRL
jgi:hypothetical protein